MLSTPRRRSRRRASSLFSSSGPATALGHHAPPIDISFRSTLSDPVSFFASASRPRPNSRPPPSSLLVFVLVAVYLPLGPLCHDLPVCFAIRFRCLKIIHDQPSPTSPTSPPASPRRASMPSSLLLTPVAHPYLPYLRKFARILPRLEVSNVIAYVRILCHPHQSSCALSRRTKRFFNRLISPSERVRLNFVCARNTHTHMFISESLVRVRSPVTTSALIRPLRAIVLHIQP
ncbi:hypothetical protein OF83DRAFT_142687 [Amylostereum chailletii]|nr:hypothetical protein OF83DRAFT_142687 [Amylostereum chailletii]